MSRQSIRYIKTPRGDFSVMPFGPEELANKLAELYLLESPEVAGVKTIKEGRHTLVQSFEHGRQSYFVKQPRGRDNRPWERVLERFRDAEVVRYAESMRKLRFLGFKGPDPVVALFRRRFGFLVESYLIYRAAEGRKAESSDGQILAKALMRLHSKGYMRRDAIPRNFLIDNEGDAVFIDFRLIRPGVFRELRLALEKDQLIRACPSASDHMDKKLFESPLFKLPYQYNRLCFWIKKFRRRNWGWLCPAIVIATLFYLVLFLGF